MKESLNLETHKVTVKNGEDIVITLPNGAKLKIFSQDYSNIIDVSVGYSSLKVLPVAPNRVGIEVGLDPRQKYLNDKERRGKKSEY